MKSLIEVLEKSKQVGFLGPGPVENHIEHSLKYAHEFIEPGWIADLGAGGGLPSIPLLYKFPDLKIHMVDSSQKRCAFLVWAISELNFTERAKVSCSKAEEFAHETKNRFAYSGVIARSFAAPAITLECAAGLLKLGGYCVISEPPETRHWPSESIIKLGLKEVPTKNNFAVFESIQACPNVYPRSFKEMKSNPIF